MQNPNLKQHYHTLIDAVAGLLTIREEEITEEDREMLELIATQKDYLERMLYRAQNSLSWRREQAQLVKENEAYFSQVRNNAYQRSYTSDQTEVLQ